MLAKEEATNKFFIYNKRTQSGLKVTGTSGSYSVKITHFPREAVST